MEVNYESQEGCFLRGVDEATVDSKKNWR
jgi:hypothetical protein